MLGLNYRDVGFMILLLILNLDQASDKQVILILIKSKVNVANYFFLKNGSALILFSHFGYSENYGY